MSSLKDKTKISKSYLLLVNNKLFPVEGKAITLCALFAIMGYQQLFSAIKRIWQLSKLEWDETFMRVKTTNSCN
jgi:hypothetical protein